MPILQSGWFPGKMNWTGVKLDFESLSSVLEVWNPSQNLSIYRYRLFPWNIEVQSKSSARGYDGFCCEVFLNAIGMLCPSPIHLVWKSTSLKKCLYCCAPVQFIRHGKLVNQVNLRLIELIQLILKWPYKFILIF